MNVRLIRIGVACLLVLTFSACLFDTRDAEDPTPDDETAVPLDDPLAPFEALTVALETRRDANYERAISRDFVFSPTPDDSLSDTWGGQPVYANWNKDVEMSVTTLLISDATFIDVNFNPTPDGPSTTTYQRFRVAYVLRVVKLSAPTDTTTYEGVARFDHRNEGGNWRLTFWDELSTVPGRDTWGFLKGELRLQLPPTTDSGAFPDIPGSH